MATRIAKYRFERDADYDGARVRIQNEPGHSAYFI